MGYLTNSIEFVEDAPILIAHVVYFNMFHTTLFFV